VFPFGRPQTWPAFPRVATLIPGAVGRPRAGAFGLAVAFAPEYPMRGLVMMSVGGPEPTSNGL